MQLDDLRDRLTRWLADDAVDPTRRISALEPIRGGWAVTTLYTATLAAGDGSSDPATTAVVVKLYPADADGIAHAAREFRALIHLAATGYAVPAVVAFEPGPRAVGRPVLVMQHVAGDSFWTVFEAAGRDARARLVPAFTDRLVTLHATDPHRLADGIDHPDPYDAIDTELAGLRRDSGAPEHVALVGVVQWLTARRDRVPCSRPVILHRDFHPWNVIVGAGGRLFVLDWDWRIGDPRFDLAWTCTLMQRSGQDEFSDAVRAEYERRTGHAVREYDYFEVLTTTRWLLNVLPALGERSQLTAAKREAFRDFLDAPVQRAQRLLHRHTGIVPPVLPVTPAMPRR